MKNEPVKVKNLLFTFDYEVFLGAKSGTVSNCLLKPTRRLTEIMSRYDVRGVFFVDTTYIARLTEAGVHHQRAKADLDLITAQLEQLVKEGHLLFHHIHPHWLDATYIENENQWDLTNNSRFTCELLNEDEKCRIFGFSTDFLHGCYQRAGSDKLPCGYRAGGLYIEPFSSVRDLFISHGINYDLSVIPGFVKQGGYPSYDYSGCPEKPIYKFSYSPGTESPDGPFTEFTISSYTLSGLKKIRNGLDYRFNKRNAEPYGDGRSVSRQETTATPKPVAKRDLMRIKNSMSIELMNCITVHESFRQTKEKQIVQFISHPKLISEKNLHYFEKYLMAVTKKYNIESDFWNIAENMAVQTR